MEDWSFDLTKAPKDGRLLLLLVEPDEHPIEDELVVRTIGSNQNDINDSGDVWQFAGWCWSHDHYTEGSGKVIGWRELPAVPSSLAAEPAPLSREGVT